MKITKVSMIFCPHRFNLLNTYQIVKIETDEGITGYGESGITLWGAAAEKAVDHLSEILIGEDPFSTERIWQHMFRGSFFPAEGIYSCAISAIDIALWDIKGKTLGRPVWDLLGGKMRESVPVYSHVSPIDDIDACVADAKRQVKIGYEALKLDPFGPEMGQHHRRYIDGRISAAGASYAEDLMSELRTAVGPEIELMIDAHGNFDVSTATELCNRMMKFDLTWFEEPLQPESLDAHRQLRSNTDINLCIGERKYTRWDFAPYLQEGLVNYIMPDICWTGGISEMKRIAILAETFYVPISPHDASGAFNVITGAHVLMNVPNIYRLEMSDHSLSNYNSVITSPLDIRDGHLFLPDKPGLGYELDHDFIASHPDPEWVKLHN